MDSEITLSTVTADQSLVKQDDGSVDAIQMVAAPVESFVQPDIDNELASITNELADFDKIWAAKNATRKQFVTDRITVLKQVKQTLNS